MVLLALSLQDQVEKYGSYVGIAAFFGLAILSLLYFAQAREVKRLREWAGRAPERAREVEEAALAAAEAARRRPGARCRAAGPGRPARRRHRRRSPLRHREPGRAGGRRDRGGRAPGGRGARRGGDAGRGSRHGGRQAPRVGDRARGGSGPRRGGRGRRRRARGRRARRRGRARRGRGCRRRRRRRARRAARPRRGLAHQRHPTAGCAAARLPPPEHRGRRRERERRARPAGGTAPPRPSPRRAGPRPRCRCAAPRRRPRRAARRRRCPPRRPAPPPASVVLARRPPLGDRRRCRRGHRRARHLRRDAAARRRPQARAQHGRHPDALGDRGRELQRRRRRRSSAPTRAETTVAVFNGTTINGLASQTADKLAGSGYKRGSTGDYTDQQRAASTVFYKRAARAQARNIARELNISDLRAMDTETQALAGERADVAVVVGSDKAPVASRDVEPSSPASSSRCWSRRASGRSSSPSASRAPSRWRRSRSSSASSRPTATTAAT